MLSWRCADGPFAVPFPHGPRCVLGTVLVMPRLPLRLGPSLYD